MGKYGVTLEPGGNGKKKTAQYRLKRTEVENCLQFDYIETLGEKWQT